MSNNSVLETIRSRRSIRHYTGQPVSGDLVEKILEAGRWAPSGLNNQPWRFAVIRNRNVLDKLASLTSYSAIIRSSNLCIAVFYHVPSGYNRDKDLMGIGACIQNMLLATHSLGIGAVWLGEILKSKEEVNTLLEIEKTNELAAVLALGYSSEKPLGKRDSLSSLIIKLIE